MFTRVRGCVSVCLYVRVFVREGACVSNVGVLCVYLYIRVFACVCVCLCVCLCVCAFECLCDCVLA